MKELNELLKGLVGHVLAEDVAGFISDTASLRYSALENDEKEMVNAGKVLKRAWSKNADHAFFKSLNKVCWRRWKRQA